MLESTVNFIGDVLDKVNHLPNRILRAFVKTLVIAMSFMFVFLIMHIIAVTLQYILLQKVYISLIVLSPVMLYFYLTDNASK